MFNRSFVPSVFLGTLLLSGSLVQPANAGPEEAATYLLDSFKTLGATNVEYKKLSTSGNSATINDVVIEAPDSHGHNATLTLPVLTIEGIEEQDDGGFKSSSIAISNLVFNDPHGLTVTTGPASIGGYTVPGPDALKALLAKGLENALSEKYESFSLKNFSFTRSDLPSAIRIGEIHLEQSDFVGKYAKQSSGHLNNLVIPIAFSRNPQVKAQFQALGYNALTLSVAYDGSWDDQTTLASIKTLSINAKDMGTVTLNGTLGGFSADLLNKLQSVTEPADVMAHIQGLTVDDLTLSFENQSVVDRVLDLQAKNAGIERDQFVQQISGVMPLLLSAIGNPEFSDKLAKAAAKFLANPTTLTATAKPANPVPVSQLIGAGIAAPQTLPDVLNVSVEAAE
ncbi:hypothetical protein [Coralliovum pocilloporae]|uniref:hypothetical protein n=1 Tax=Coralliovum pocilloporae TaxID=3066369 RepID=UPI00330789F6